MATSFEEFVARELPRRPTLLTYGITGYDGDPNDPGVPDIVRYAPPGTLFLRHSNRTLWYKRTALAGSWTDITTGAAPATNMRYQVMLLGVKDGSNRVFTTPDKFAPGSERVHRNGMRLVRGMSADYTTQESGGPGTGYDTITFNVQPDIEIAPLADEDLFIDYAVTT